MQTLWASHGEHLHFNGRQTLSSSGGSSSISGLLGDQCQLPGLGPRRLCLLCRPLAQCLEQSPEQWVAVQWLNVCGSEKFLSGVPRTSSQAVSSALPALAALQAPLHGPGLNQSPHPLSLRSHLFLPPPGQPRDPQTLVGIRVTWKTHSYTDCEASAPEPLTY